jgi:hypothetical protein
MENEATVRADLLRALNGDDLTLERRQAARAFINAWYRPTVRWASPRPGEHIIDGVRLRPELVGMDAAFCAAAAPGQRLVKAADFCAPGAAHPDIAIRAALKRAAAFLDAYSPGLAEAVRGMRVVGGHVVYKPSGRLDVVTI